MNSILVSSIVFVCVFAAAVVGMVVRVPEDHLGADAKDVVRLATGLVATMASIILGMLVSSAKTSYDARKNDVAELSAEILTIDRMLARYGSETNEIRGEFRQTVEFGVDRVWPNQTSRQADLRPTDRGDNLINELEQLTPKNDRQAAVKAQAHIHGRLPCGKRNGYCSSRRSRTPCRFHFWWSWSLAGRYLSQLWSFCRAQLHDSRDPGR